MGRPLCMGQDDRKRIHEPTRAGHSDVRNGLQCLLREHAGYELRTASERLRLLGALFQIESERSKGTTCTIRFSKDNMDGVPTITAEKDVDDAPSSSSRS